jgi:hypothetical protein
MAKLEARLEKLEAQQQRPKPLAVVYLAEDGQTWLDDAQWRGGRPVDKAALADSTVLVVRYENPPREVERA